MISTSQFKVLDRLRLLYLLVYLLVLEPVQAALPALLHAGELVKTGSGLADAGQAANDLFKGTNGALHFAGGTKALPNVLDKTTTGTSLLPGVGGMSKLKPHTLPNIDGSTSLAVNPKLNQIRQPPVSSSRFTPKVVPEPKTVVPPPSGVAGAPEPLVNLHPIEPLPNVENANGLGVELAVVHSELAQNIKPIAVPRHVPPKDPARVVAKPVHEPVSIGPFPKPNRASGIETPLHGVNPKFAELEKPIVEPVPSHLLPKTKPVVNKLSRFGEEAKLAPKPESVNPFPKFDGANGVGTSLLDSKLAQPLKPIAEPRHVPPQDPARVVVKPVHEPDFIGPFPKPNRANGIETPIHGVNSKFAELEKPIVEPAPSHLLPKTKLVANKLSRFGEEAKLAPKPESVNPLPKLDEANGAGTKLAVVDPKTVATLPKTNGANRVGVPAVYSKFKKVPKPIVKPNTIPPKLLAEPKPVSTTKISPELTGTVLKSEKLKGAAEPGEIATKLASETKPDSKLALNTLYKFSQESKAAKVKPVKPPSELDGAAKKGFFTSMNSAKIKEATSSLVQLIKNPGKVLADMWETWRTFKAMRFVAKYSRDIKIREWANGHPVTQVAREYEKEQGIISHFLTRYLKMHPGWTQKDVALTQTKILEANKAALESPPGLFTKTVKLTEDVIKGIMAIPFYPIALGAKVWEGMKPGRAVGYLEWLQTAALKYIREDMAKNFPHYDYNAVGAAKGVKPPKFKAITWHDTHITTKVGNAIGSKTGA